jgi:hypothetical protein
MTAMLLSSQGGWLAIAAWILIALAAILGAWLALGGVDRKGR